MVYVETKYEGERNAEILAEIEKVKVMASEAAERYFETIRRKDTEYMKARPYSLREQLAILGGIRLAQEPYIRLVADLYSLLTPTLVMRRD